MRPKNWNKWARLLWMMGHSGGEEHVRDARRRAAKAAEVLVARAGEGQDVVLAAHGWFNRMLRPELKKRGLLFVGIDVIGGKWLTEINVTSPTGMRAAQKLYGVNLAAQLWDAIEAMA